MKYRNLADFLAYVKARDPQQPEFHQAVREVVETIMPTVERAPAYKKAKILAG